MASRRVGFTDLEREVIELLLPKKFAGRRSRALWSVYHQLESLCTLAQSRCVGPVSGLGHPGFRWLGVPIGLHLSEGQASDCREAEPLLDTSSAANTFLADKAYDSTPTSAKNAEHPVNQSTIQFHSKIE